MQILGPIFIDRWFLDFYSCHMYHYSLFSVDFEEDDLTSCCDLKELLLSKEREHEDF